MNYQEYKAQRAAHTAYMDAHGVGPVNWYAGKANSRKAGHDAFLASGVDSQGNASWSSPVVQWALGNFPFWSDWKENHIEEWPDFRAYALMRAVEQYNTETGIICARQEKAMAKVQEATEGTGELRGKEGMRYLDAYFGGRGEGLKALGRILQAATFGAGVAKVLGAGRKGGVMAMAGAELIMHYREGHINPWVNASKKGIPKPTSWNKLNGIGVMDALAIVLAKFIQAVVLETKQGRDNPIGRRSSSFGEQFAATLEAGILETGLSRYGHEALEEAREASKAGAVAGEMFFWRRFLQTPVVGSLGLSNAKGRALVACFGDAMAKALRGSLKSSPAPAEGVTVECNKALVEGTSGQFAQFQRVTEVAFSPDAVEAMKEDAARLAERASMWSVSHTFPLLPMAGECGSRVAAKRGNGSNWLIKKSHKGLPNERASSASCTVRAQVMDMNTAPTHADKEEATRSLDAHRIYSQVKEQRRRENKA